MRILILGASGMIGHCLWRELTIEKAEVFGTLHRDTAVLDRCGLRNERIIEGFEASDFKAVTATLDRISPDVIINCIGITKRKVEAEDLAKAFQVNARFPHHLAFWAGCNRARIIHFSTDCVFDGADGNYSERSVVTASDLYGQTKYFGELDYENCLTIRTSMIGRELAGHSELLEWFLAQRGKRIKGFKNALYSGLTTLEMAKIVSQLMKHYPKLSGKYQIAGPVISKYDLLMELREAYALDIEIMPDETFRCDRTLQSRKFSEATGIQIPSWKAMTEALADDRRFYDAHEFARL